MDWKILIQAGAAVVVTYLFLKFLRWLIPYMTAQSMKAVVEVVQDFKEMLANHMDHQAKEHKAFLDAEKEQTDLLRKLNGNSHPQS